MNNRNERLEYIKKNFSFKNLDMLTEECFITEVVKNDYAMNYVKKELKKVDEDDSNLLKTYENPIKYNTRAMVATCHSKLENLEMVLKYINYAEYSENLQMIENLFKKSFSKLYRGFKSGRIEFDNEDIELNLAMFYMALVNEDVEKFDGPMMEMFTPVGMRYLSQFYTFEDVSISKDTEEKMFTKFEFLVKKYKLNKPVKIADILFHLRQSTFDEATKTLIKRGYEEDNAKELALEKLMDEKHFYDMFRNNINLTKMYSFGSNQSELFQHFCYGEYEVENVELAKDDMVKVLYVLNDYVRYNNLTETDIEVAFVNFAVETGIFKSLKERIFELSRVSIELTEQKMRYRKMEEHQLNKIYILMEELENASKRILDKEEEIENLENEIANLKAKLSSLNDKNRKEDYDKKELIQLRELFFSLEQEDVEYIEDDFKIDEEMNIAFVGGVDALQLKVKEIFPTFIMVKISDMNKDLSFLKNMDYIFIHTDMKHGLYYKVIEILRNKKIKYSFLNGANIDLLKGNILNKLKKYKQAFDDK